MFVLHQLIWFLFIYLLLFVESGLKYICTLKKVIYIYIYILCLNFNSPLKAPPLFFSFLFFLPFWHRHFGKTLRVMGLISLLFSCDEELLEPIALFLFFFKQCNIKTVSCKRKNFTK